MASDFSYSVEEEKGLSHHGKSWEEKERARIFSCPVLACIPPAHTVPELWDDITAMWTPTFPSLLTSITYYNFYT